MLCIFRINLSLRWDFLDAQSRGGEPNAKGLWECSLWTLSQARVEGRAVCLCDWIV